MSAARRDYISPNRPDDYIYVIRNELGRVKIGVSNDPDGRIDSLSFQSGMFFTILSIAPLADAYWVEKYLHRQFRDKRYHGEWFTLSEIEIADTLRFIAKKEQEFWELAA